MEITPTMTAARARPTFLASFTKSQTAATVATVVDWALLSALVEFFHVWYVIAVAVGAVAGAITNFLMNRHWSFRATHAHWKGQALRYALASTISVLLNTGGVYALTEWYKIHYFLSVLVVSIAVGVLVNFPLHRYYVFR